MLDDELKPEVFGFLEALRVSGVTNMLAAPTYLMQEFGFDWTLAVDYFDAWAQHKEARSNG